MEDEKLIELVSNYEFIYNLQHPKYMDSVKKEDAWKHIGDTMKQPAVACKQRWQGLRDSYRRSLNKRKLKSGQAAKRVKKWKYEDEISFLAPFFLERKISDLLEFTSDEEHPDIGPCDIHPDQPEKRESCIDNIGRLDNSEGQEDFQNTVHSKTLNKTTKVNPAQSASAILMGKLLEDQNNLPSRREHDELDLFFLNISATVKKFPPYEQALAKNRIFSTVSEMELQLLAPPFATSALYPYQFSNNTDTLSPPSTSSTLPNVKSMPASPDN